MYVYWIGHFRFPPSHPSQESVSALQSQAVELEHIQRLGEEMLASCHPDSIITLKSWISVTKTRYEEVGVVMATE